MKLGNTSFNEKAIKKMKWAKFQKTYKGVLKGISLEDAYVRCGGKLPKKLS